MTQSPAKFSKSMFRQSVTVGAKIHATPARVWALLTDAQNFASWNSTVTSIEGPIELGRKVKIRVPVSTRVFSPVVVEFQLERRMVWKDGMAPMFTGVRVYELTPNGAGVTNFTMTETFSGVMLPLIRGSLPDFVPIFNQYAADLKRAAEA